MDCDSLQATYGTVRMKSPLIYLAASASELDDSFREHGSTSVTSKAGNVEAPRVTKKKRYKELCDHDGVVLPRNRFPHHGQERPVHLQPSLRQQRCEVADIKMRSAKYPKTSSKRRKKTKMKRKR